MTFSRNCGLASVFALVATLFLSAANAQVQGGAVPLIEQERGVDQRVVYAKLTAYGPWDDHNYQLTQEDLAILPVNDQYLHSVPAFYKVQKRKEMSAQGFPLIDLYPREIDKEFEMRYGGLTQNGVLQRRGLGVYYHPDPNNPPPAIALATDPLPHAVPINGEGAIDGVLSDNEVSIEYHPIDPQIVIAGSNGSGGQRQSYSTDSGLTWFSAGALPQSCCDPSMDFSPDGTVAFAATLGRATGAGFLKTEIYRSTNNGQTWGSPISPSTAGSDKEFIHVDRSPTSPFVGRLYVTWHQGNVMCFARSTQTSPTLVLAPTQCFPDEERGIGSDITTDAQGNIYYVYPSLTTGSTEIRVMVSTDGGVTFAPSVAAYDLHGRFDFAIPSMETRRAFTYVAADADQTGGPNDGRVYITFTDIHPSSPAGGGGTAAQNHGWVQVVYSDDQGATWTTAATPHAESDIATVDRYHPWLDVDSSGNVHIGFYDTRHSTNRTGVDWYYTLSLDGGASWIEETRVSAITSQNINDGQEWGDYNGLSISQGGAGATVGMTWTDNRINPPGPNPTQASFAGRVLNIGAGPTFLLAGTNLTQSVCTLQTAANPATLFGNSFEYGGTLLSSVLLNVNALNGFNSTVAFSFDPALPAGVEGSFTPPSLTPPGSSLANIGVTPAALAGSYGIGLEATGGPVTRVANLTLNIATSLPLSPLLVSPLDDAVNVALAPTLSWTLDQGQSSIVEVSTTSNFSTIGFSTTVNNGGTSVTIAPPLQSNTKYFWRVRSSNTCGGGPNSVVRSFTTAPAPGDCASGVTPNTVFFDNIENGDNGWTTSSGTTPPSQVWSRSTARPFSPTNAWLAVDVITASDQRLMSPPIVLPSGQSPLTLSFQQDRSLEPRSGGCWDGGILEVSTNDGALWTQVTPAQILTVPYTGPLGNGSAGTGLQAWCGVVPYARTVVDLNSFAGQTIRLRYRMFSDASIGNVPHGWYIDDVRVKGCPP